MKLIHEIHFKIRVSLAAALKGLKAIASQHLKAAAEAYRIS